MESDSDDDVPVKICRKKRVAILEESDEEDVPVGDGNDAAAIPDNTVTSKEMDSDNEDSRGFDEENVSENESSDDGDVEDAAVIPNNTVTSKLSNGLASDLFDAEMDSDNEAGRGSDKENVSDNESSDDGGVQDAAVIPNNTVTSKLSNGLASDLFDAEMDSDNEAGQGSDKENVSDNESSDDGVQADKANSGNSSRSEDDDEPDISEMSANLKRRLKKGAGKKPGASGSNGGSSKVHRPNKNEVQDIHFESQRIVRESSVRLPYHKPEKEKVGLSVFLARCQKKQDQLQSIKRSGPAWKHTPEPQAQPKVQLPPRAQTVEKLKTSPERTSQDGDDDIKQTSLDKVDVVKKDILKDLDHAEEDWDELPELSVENESAKVQYEIVTAEEDQIEVQQNIDSATINKGHVEEKQCTESVTEQESGYISIPTSEEENSGDHSKKAPHKPKDSCDEIGSTQCQESSVFTDNVMKSVENTVKNDICSQNDSSPVIGTCLKMQTHLTPKLANLTVDNFTPKLSGAPNCFIDFDDDNQEQSTPKMPSGIVNLMERVVKHSAKHTRKKSKDVEISLVAKVTNEEKEELKLKKLTYHVDEKEEETEGETPGAKLLLLKEKLRERMKQKRAESRQKRQELHAYDNEEGFEGGHPMDEEAELTDQTDTDDEPEEELFDDEEDLLGGHEDAEEEELEEEDNPFVDDEAEEEEDEDDELEESLHLKLDLVEEDGESKQQTESPPRKDFLQAALKKTKTLELFDEDANTESPTMSQNSNGCTPEISSRPFQQLSGTSDKDEAMVTEDDQDDILMLDTQPLKNTGLTSVQELTRDKDTSLLSADSSFEMMGSYISAGQKSSKKNRTRELITPDLLTPSSKSSATNSTMNKNASRMSDLTMPIEDSQDLLAISSPSKDSIIKPSQNRSPKFDFQIEETQSLMLDDEGLFKVRSVPKPRRQLLLDQSTRGSTSIGTEDELLALCSGKFTADSQQTDRESHTSKSLFGDSQSTVSSTQNNMDELLGLCSGRFTGPSQNQRTLRLADTQDRDVTRSLQNGTGSFNVVSHVEDSMESSTGTQSAQRKRKRAVIHDDDSNDSFEAVGGGDEDDDKNEALSSDDEAVDGAAQDALDSDDEEMQQVRQFRGFVNNKKQGKIRREFVDEEAELSGSEYDSDENYDIAEKDDLLEMEAGDLDDVGTEADLRDQVNRVHLKSVIDADKKELRLFQEMYLQDGDMHSDGAGRKRNFRWRNIDGDTQQDMFDKSDDEDAENEETHEEQAWRVKRFEREKFLMEQKEKGEQDEEVIKLGKVVFKPKKDKNSPLVVKESVAPEKAKHLPKEGCKENFTKPKLPVHGSFLRRSKDALAKFADMTKPMTTIGGARKTGKFVFSAVTADEKEKEKQMEENKRPQVKRSISASQQPNKRPRLERSNSIPTNSIFNHM